MLWNLLYSFFQISHPLDSGISVQKSGVFSGQIRVENNQVQSSKLAGSSSIFGIGRAGFRLIEIIHKLFFVSQPYAGDRLCVKSAAEKAETLTRAEGIWIGIC